jgi:AhpD family alkylhydroperoxidase
MTETELEQRYPWIAWREPIPISAGSAHGLGCRFCVAMHGLQGKNVGHLPQTPEEFAFHMNLYHPL